VPTHRFASRNRRGVERHIIKRPHGGHESPESVGLRRKRRHHFALKDGKIVGEAQGAFAARAEGDPRLLLFTEGKLIAVNAELAQQFAQWRAFDPGPHKIGHRVEAHVEFSSRDTVKTIQPADGVVPFEDTDLLAEVREANASGEA